MSRLGAAAPPRLVPRFADLLARWKPGNPLRKSLANFSDEELDRVLSAAGRNRADLFTVFKGNAKHRQFLARMFQHFGVDPHHAAQTYWDALKSADRVCAECTNTKRCRNWLAWRLRNDAPRVFCPNAELFDEIAQAASTTRSSSIDVDDRHEFRPARPDRYVTPMFLG